MSEEVAGPFSHGVASFDPSPESVLLWTRAPGVGRVRWCVARTADGAPVASGEADVEAGHDHCVTVAVDGLDPATTWFYWFEAGGSRSRVGRTRTLPAGGTDPLRLAVVCCGDYSRGHFTVYRAVAEADVDLVLHVGDYIYETKGKGDVRQAEPDHEVVTLADYRTRYAQSRGDPDLIALHQRHPMVTVWDDHDIADNAWRGGAKGHDPNAHGRWEDRLRAAATAHHEWLPARLAGEDPLRVWRSTAIGDLAELVVLDTRIAGRDQQADDESALPWDDPGRSLLGEAQRAWAHARIRDRSRPWCLLVTQVVLNRMELPVEHGAQLGELAPSGYAVIGGEAMCTDEWDGYPAERDALVRAIADRGRGVVALSGDVHSAWAFEGPCDGFGDAVAVEFTAPCVTATPMARQLPAGWRRLVDRVAERLPEARWFELEHHGLVILELTLTHADAHWYCVDSEDPQARPRHAASWRHRWDEPGRLEQLPDPGDRPLAPRHRPAGTGSATWPRVPDRPASVAASHRRRRLRRWAGRAAVVTFAAALAALVARRSKTHLRMT
jgi:alkaline phosphatase D